MENIKLYIKNNKDLALKILSFFGSLIFAMFVGMNFVGRANSLVFLAILILSYHVITKLINNVEKKKEKIIVITSIIFAIIEVICMSINTDYTLNNIINKRLPINIIGYFITSYIIMKVYFNFLDTIRAKKNQVKTTGNTDSSNKSIKKILIYVLIILIAWGSHFLTYYPGILSWDSLVQVEQALGLTEVTNHHPVFSTAIVTFFINIGKNCFNNINFGVALFTLFQMIIMSTVFANIVFYNEKKTKNKMLTIITILYYMFYPIHAIFAVTMWKDILFSGLIPIFILNTVELITNTEKYLEDKKNIFLYILFSLFVIFSRNNGLYVFMLTVPFIAIYLRKKWRKIVPLFVSIIVLYLCIDTVLFGILKIKKSQPGEALSIPIQQIARTEKYNRETLTDEQKEKINKFFKVKNIGDNYKEVISDPVKAEFNNEYYKEHKGEFYSLWFELLVPHFKDYVESFLSNSYGYYCTETSYWITNRRVEENQIGVYSDPIIKGNITQTADSVIDMSHLPIISMMFCIGFAFWLIIWNLAYVILKKEYKLIIIYIPILVLWLTLIASPVFCEFRYAYPFFTTIPIFIGLNTIEKEKMKGKKDE